MCKLLKSECWRIQLTVEELEKAFGVLPLEEFDFLTLEGMQSETNAAKRLLNESDSLETFGIDSSQRAGSTITAPEILDVDASVLFAVNWADEAIALDYRSSPTEPRILLSVYPKSSQPEKTRWVELASSFEEFARRIRIWDKYLDGNIEEHSANPPHSP